MAVNCPHCSHTLKPKSVRPGRFQPKCPGCGRVFLLVVTADAPPQLQVAALSTSSADLNVTSPPPAAQPGVEAPPSSDFSVASAAVAERPAESDQDIPRTLGNYQIIRQLGRGGMGAVYLARQISLDRPVALKVMNAEWAQNPSFLVRFTREAYAAAQLVHHNVVQVYDIGADHGVHYFSMEYVQGKTLGELLRVSRRLPPDEAAGYILQAARGLQFAHERGMIHRDIKPDNLMLNDQGVVKVADLGLVRTPGAVEEDRGTGGQADKGKEGEAPAVPWSPCPAVSLAPNPGRSLGNLSNVTMAGQAVGTPAYMAPEQARDATRVDHRADVYSLGCTLYVLVTGRPVFPGNTALEVMTAHAFEPVVPPDNLVKGLPRALSDVIVKMLAKKPDDRYASMAEVTRALEDYLQIGGAMRLAQDEQHLNILEQSVKAFHSAGVAGLRTPILLGFFGGCAFLFVLLALLGFWKAGGGVLGLGVMTALSYFVVHGLTHRTYLFQKVRDMVLSSSWFDFVKLGAGVLLFALILWLVGLFGVWLLATLLSVGLAIGFHYAVDKRIAADRTAPLDKVERLLKALRMRGLSEEALHEFISKNAGEHWEEFFEALFGYEAKLKARAVHGVGTKGMRPRFAGWRDPVVRWVDRYQRTRQEARERRHLQEVEQANLVAQGVDASQAREQAGRVADAMVHMAAELRQLAPSQQPPAPPAVVVPAPPAQATVVPQATPVVPPPPSRPTPPRRVGFDDFYEVSSEPTGGRRRSRFVEDLIGVIFGNGVRFLLGAGLLAISLLWLHTRELLPGSSDIEEGWRWQRLWEQSQVALPLTVPAIPAAVMQALCSLGAVAAGAVLVASALWRSYKIGVLTLLAAAVMVIGPHSGLVPEEVGLAPLPFCLVAGAGIAALGFLFGRDT
jgi:serine/threonine protein kinase